MRGLLVGGGVGRHVVMDTVHNPQRRTGFAVLPLLPLAPLGVDDVPQKGLRGNPASLGITFDLSDESFHRLGYGNLFPLWQGISFPSRQFFLCRNIRA